MKVDYTTSKVWQIVRRADMLERYCHVGTRFDQLPDYHYVVDAFLADDKQKRIVWANKMAEESRNTMNEVIIQ